MIVAKRFRMIILRECRVRDLREMGVGWVRDGCDVQAMVVLCGCGAGDDGAAMARAARCGDARRIFCCHLGDGRGGTVGFPRKRDSARFTASNRHFSPVFLCFLPSLSPVVSERGLPPTRPRHARCATPLREDLPRRDLTIACMSNAKSDNISVRFALSLCHLSFICFFWLV